MGLLDQVVGDLVGGSGGGSPMQGVLMNLLGGQSGTGQGAVPPQQSTGGTGINGLGALVAAFQQAGLGHIVQSCINNGPNTPVSPQQLRGVLGDDQVQTMANQSGMRQEDFLSQLSQHLPNAVSGVTPNGQLPDEGTVSV